MEEDNVALPRPFTSDISATPCKRVRQNVLNPNLTAVMDLQK